MNSISSRRAAAFQLTALVLSVATCVVLLIPAPAVLRFVVALAFVACGPGTAVVSLLAGRSPATFDIGLVVALGFASAVLVSELFIWTGNFNPRPDVIGATVVVSVVVGVSRWRSVFGTNPSGRSDRGWRSRRVAGVVDVGSTSQPSPAREDAETWHQTTPFWLRFPADPVSNLGLTSTSVRAATQDIGLVESQPSDDDSSARPAVVSGLIPTSGRVGASVSISASGFLGSRALTVTVGGVPARITDGGTTDARGTSTLTFAIPSVAMGSQAVVVSDGANAVTSSTGLTVTTATTTNASR